MRNVWFGVYLEGGATELGDRLGMEKELLRFGDGGRKRGKINDTRLVRNNPDQNPDGLSSQSDVLYTHHLILTGQLTFHSLQFPTFCGKPLMGYGANLGT